MSELTEKMKSELARLSHQERAELAHFLIESLDADEPDVEEAWDVELRRRIAEIESGQVQGIPAEEVLAEMRKLYP